jgi:hypothetical protein
MATLVIGGLIGSLAWSTLGGWILRVLARSTDALEIAYPDAMLSIAAATAIAWLLGLAVGWLVGAGGGTPVAVAAVEILLAPLWVFTQAGVLCGRHEMSFNKALLTSFALMVCLAATVAVAAGMYALWSLLA